MTDITQYLNDILTKTDGEDVTSAILSVLNALVEDRYQNVDISSEIDIIEHNAYGKNVKRAIYDSLVALSSETPTGTPFEPDSSALYIGKEVYEIDTKDYGRDIRRAIHDALLKLAIYKPILYPITIAYELDENHERTGNSFTFSENKVFKDFMEENVFTLYDVEISVNDDYTIPKHSYRAVTNMYNVEIGNGFTSIDESAFSYSVFESIYIPNSVSTIAVNAFKEVQFPVIRIDKTDGEIAGEAWGAVEAIVEWLR